MWKTWGGIFIFCLLLVWETLAQGAGWPKGISFVGFSEGQWKLHIVPSGASRPQNIEKVSDPRTPTYLPRQGKVAYIGADGHVHEFTLENNADHVLLSKDAQSSFTQPAYNTEGNKLFVVVLKEGASIDTTIVALEKGEKHPIVTQPLAQFEPYFQAPNTLYYSSVACTLGCGKIIQELWRMDLVSGEADQLTLLNAIARQPVVSADGQWLYFASNKAGNFHIWRMALASGKSEQLTTGRVTDESPALDRNDILYFIRHSPTGVQLLRREPQGALHPLPLPASITDLRDLEIHQ